MFDFIQKLASIFPRYGVDEMRAAKVIADELTSNNITYVEEKFKASVPRIINANLFVDGVEVPCLGSSFATGDIESNKFLIDSLNDPEEHLPYSIGYSSASDEISVVSFFDEPSVTVSKKYIPQIKLAKTVFGHVEVAQEKFNTENILVGNTINPKNIIVAHFDSIIGPGAMDNAAAVSVLMEIIKTNQSILQDNLFLFSGNEEISYEKLPYSGHGYREFESLHSPQLDSAYQIIVVDGIGISSPNFTQEQLDIVLQFKSLNSLRSKIYWLQNDQSLVLQNYHSLTDTIDKINPIFLEEAKDLLIKKIIL